MQSTQTPKNIFFGLFYITREVADRRHISLAVELLTCSDADQLSFFNQQESKVFTLNFNNKIFLSAEFFECCVTQCSKKDSIYKTNLLVAWQL